MLPLGRALVLSLPTLTDPQLQHWDPLLPDRVGWLHFGKWNFFLCRAGGLLAAECGDKSLLWNTALGLGVCTDLPLTQSLALYFQNGSFFAATDAKLYIVPLVTEEGGVAAAYARPLPTQVPADLPFVRARLLASGGSCVMPPSVSNAPLLPPLFLSDHADPRLLSCI